MTTLLLARTVCNYSEEQVWTLPNRDIVLEFDDGERFETRGRETILSWYLWHFHRMFPEVPLLRKHHIPRNRLTKGIFGDVCSECFFSAYDVMEGRVNIEDMCEQFYSQVINKVYNRFNMGVTGRYITTFDILEVLNFVDHPEVVAIREQLEPTVASVEHAYNQARALFKRPDKIDSQMVRSAASDLVSGGQLLQLSIARGFITDIDSSINPNPVLDCFATGVNDLYGSMMDSRSTSKSLYFASEPLQAVEYFNRKMQLITATVMFLVHGDCGKRTYSDWLIRPHDLKPLKGLRRMENGKEVMMNGTEKHLIGTVVKLRLPSECALDGHCVCSACFGELSKSLPHNSNIGHFSGTTMCEESAQAVLSIKHLDGSADVEAIDIDGSSMAYITEGGTSSTICKSEQLNGRRCAIIIDARDAKTLIDVCNVPDLSEISPQGISELSSIVFRVWDDNGAFFDEVVPTTFGSRKCFLSMAMLRHIRANGWSLTEPRGDYLIDITTFPADEVFLQLPLRHINMVDYMSGIERIYKGNKRRNTTGKGQMYLTDFADIVPATMYFHDMVQSKLNVSIAHLSVMLRGARVKSRDEMDFHIPNGNQGGEFGVYSENMMWGSLSAKMAYQEQHNVFINPTSYTINYRRDHPLDSFVKVRS